jgi:hypothetical protein
VFYETFSFPSCTPFSFHFPSIHPSPTHPVSPHLVAVRPTSGIRHIVAWVRKRFPDIELEILDAPTPPGGEAGEMGVAPPTAMVPTGRWVGELLGMNR